MYTILVELSYKVKDRVFIGIGMLRAIALAAFFQPVLSAQHPTLEESGLSLTLFAEDPDIVTPVGLAVGENDEVYVIESHTHSPPRDYPGPETDRVKVFYDEDKDGVADGFRIFAEGFNAGMNLAFSRDGVLYIICAWSLYALPDRDGDGICDGPELILTLDTKAGNPHGCWLGITFDEDNYMYLSRGNVGAEYWRVEGNDGSVLEGYGDGGNVIRAKADGTGLREWATGFWNSMDLKFDHKGNLLLIDNDPDARGPNRLVRIVEGGDYGHIHMFGGDGRHPFQGWDGSFPGNLPYLSGTGEAPSGIIDVSEKGEHSVLVTVWNENTIERHTILEDGEVENSLFMSGDKDFRPVALDQDSSGNLFISDWVLVDYPNHGRGKIWRVSKLPIPEPDPQPAPEEPKRRTIKKFLTDSDPFVRHQGEMWLAQGNRKAFATRLSRYDDPRVRLGAYLALRRMGAGENRDLIQAALGDESIEVRQMALLWAAQALDLSLRPALDQALTAGEVTPFLFNAYLAAVEMVNRPFIEAYGKKETNAKKLPRELEPGLLSELARNASLSPGVRAEAVKRLTTGEAMEFLDSGDEPVLLAAIDKLAAVNDPHVKERLAGLALGGEHSGKVRAEAVLGLSKQVIENPSRFVPLLRDPDRTVAYEATRTLRNHLGDPAVKQAFTGLDQKSHGDPGQDAVVSMALHGFPGDRPATPEAWKQAALGGGDPARGSRVFRTTRSMCTLCHAVDGGGTKLGPDLGGIAQSISTEQIVQAILRPSETFPPQYQAWNIHTTDGKVHTGLQIDHQRGGAMLLYTTDNYNRRFEADEVKYYEASPYSLMPQGLENTMTVPEFRDLIAYLSTLK